MNIWEILGIEPTNDVKAIKKAYALKTRECHPEDDSEGFQRLHEAFSQAMAQAKSGAARAAQPEPEKPETPEDPFDIDLLIERGLRQKQEEQREKRETVIAAFEVLASGERRGDRKVWAEALDSLEFMEVRDDPELIELLREFLLAHKNLSASVWMEFFYAYGFNTPRPSCMREPYSRLHEVLYPRCRQFEIHQAEQQKREQRRIYAGSALALFVLIGACYLIYIDEELFLIPILMIAAALFLVKRFSLHKRFLALSLIKQAACLAAGWVATAAVWSSGWFHLLLRSAPVVVGGIFCMWTIPLGGLSLFFLAEFGVAVRDKW